MSGIVKLFTWWSVVTLVWAATAAAAVPLRVEAIPDGSLDPPGDLLELELLFLPGETEVTLEVRAFRVEEMPTYKATPIPSRGATTRDARGNYLQTAKALRPKEGNVAKVELPIAYAHLGLGTGMQGMAFEITGRSQDKVDFVRATKVSYVVVTTRTRTQMQVSREKVRLVTKTDKQAVNIIKDGKITTTEVDIPSEVPTFATATEKVKVSIPGEFKRPLLAKSMAFPSQDDENVPWDALPLGGAAWESLDKFEPKSKRTILYATSRNIADAKQFTPARFGNKTAEKISYGSAVVNIPIEMHRKGELEVPNWWSARDPSKHFLIESLAEFSVADFQKAVSAGDCLLFVHGYNTNFEFSVLRTAQLVHDLEFPGQGVAFSWPSAGKLTSYFHDEKEAEKSIGALVELLGNLKSTVADRGSHKIHVIAHSMGNRVFLNALRQYELKHPKAEAFLGQVALAAPDVDGASFAALLPGVKRLSQYVTFYYCSNDRALVASRTVHQDKPVGLGPWFAEGMETVNADNANTEMLGHGYYASSHPLLVDLRLFLIFREPADKRLPPLAAKTLVLGYPHWAFSPLR